MQLIADCTNFVIPGFLGKKWRRICEKRCGRLPRDARLPARREVSGMGSMLRTTTLPSLPAIFFREMPSSLRTRRDFVSGKLILSIWCLAQRRKTSSRPRGERHGLSVTWNHPTERVCCFFSRQAFIFADASRFCEWKIDTLRLGTWRSDAKIAAGHEVSGMG